MTSTGESEDFVINVGESDVPSASVSAPSGAGSDGGGAQAWQDLAAVLESALHLAAPAIFISFADERPASLPEFDGPMYDAAADGRRGRVPAGCVFWMHATQRAFSTVAEDHGNCSVGSITHGFKRMEDVAGNSDVAELLESGWVTPEAVGGIPAVAGPVGSVSYGPLRQIPDGVDPSVVLLRVTPRQLMILSDAIPELRIEGKPQCHIVPLAKSGIPAASVGCALSRARTGMPPEEMTCALPGNRLEHLTREVVRTVEVDTTVARYAAQDARRFA